jgi:UDP-N-acetylmuramoylalanine--D-glutamate ligase
MNIFANMATIRVTKVKNKVLSDSMKLLSYTLVFCGLSSWFSISIGASFGSAISYQLDYTQNLELLTGVVLNITPDHLDRYPSFEHYAKSKLSLYQYCQHPVINADEPLTSTIDNAKYFGTDIPKKDSDFGTVICHGSCYILKGDDPLMDVDDMLLIGQHNIVNVLAALALGEQIGLNTDSMITTIKTFKGLEHRLEWITKKQNINYYNDSKATNAIATITALNALIDKYKNIVLIAGGIKKQEDYSALFELIEWGFFNA